MKKVLMITSAMAFGLAGAANADVVFEKGTFALNLGLISGEDVSLFDVDAQAAFTTGTLGFQLDGGMTGITDFSDIESFGAFGVHFYKNTASGAKFGAYLANSYFVTQVGAEGMVSLGAFDVEGSAGIITEGYGPENIYNATLDVYYGISDRIELNAGVNHLFDSNNSFTIFEVGGSYMLPNNDIALNIGYRSFDSESVIDAGVSWSFGPNQDMRLFGKRGIDIFLFGA